MKSEVDKFLIMYRSTPHSTTRVSPAKLLYGREYRSKLPQLEEFTGDSEVRDRDSEKKEKEKLYADSKRNTAENKIQVGDRVLLKQEKKNKLSTTFEPVPVTVVQKQGSSVLVQKEDGAQYRRNTTHIKKLLGQDDDESTPTSLVNADQPEETLQETTPKDSTSPVQTSDEKQPLTDDHLNVRPKRERRLPKRFDDNVLGYVKSPP